MMDNPQRSRGLKCDAGPSKLRSKELEGVARSIARGERGVDESYICIEESSRGVKRQDWETGVAIRGGGGWGGGVYIPSVANHPGHRKRLWAVSSTEILALQYMAHGYHIYDQTAREDMSTVKVYPHPVRHSDRNA